MTQTNSQLPVLTEDIAKMQLNIDLTKSGIAIQKLADMESALVYNEDEGNISQIQTYIGTAKKAKKVVTDGYDRIVEKPKQEVANALSVKKAFLAMIDAPLTKADAELQKIQLSLAEKKRKQTEKVQREIDIRLGISKNLEYYSQQIAQCDTFEKLREVENRVNLEKANKSKYGDMYEEAKAAYETLTNAIKEQKGIIKDKIALTEQLKSALSSEDDGKAIEIQEKLEKLDEKIEENKILVQEKAISTVMNQEVSVAEEVLPDLHYKRRSWSWELVDIKVVSKKRPDWVQLVTVDESVSAFMKEKRDEWNEKDEIEVIVDGIKFIRTKKLA
jgi:hypothetical protein